MYEFEMTASSVSSSHSNDDDNGSPTIIDSARSFDEGTHFQLLE